MPDVRAGVNVHDQSDPYTVRIAPDPCQHGSDPPAASRTAQSRRSARSIRPSAASSAANPRTAAKQCHLREPIQCSDQPQRVAARTRSETKRASGRRWVASLLLARLGARVLAASLQTKWSKRRSGRTSRWLSERTQPAVDDLALARRLVRERKRQSRTGDSAGVVSRPYICTATPWFARRPRPSKFQRLVPSPTGSRAPAAGDTPPRLSKQQSPPRDCVRRGAITAGRRRTASAALALIVPTGTVALAHRRGWQRRRFGRTRGIAEFRSRGSLPMIRLTRAAQAGSAYAHPRFCRPSREPRSRRRGRLSR